MKTKLSNMLITTVIVLTASIFVTSAIAQDLTDKTKQQVDEAIQTAGRTMPDWWESTKLDHPDTLDLSWPVRQQPQGFGGRGGFQPNQSAEITNVDDYLQRVVFTSPEKYKSGIKLVNQLMIQHKDDADKLKRSLNTLGNMFYQLMNDYARAAFWWQKAEQAGQTIDTLKMTKCYYKLGSKSAAKELLSGIDQSNTANNKEILTLLAQVGELDKALNIIQSAPASPQMGRGGRGSAPSSPEDAKNIIAAEVCRSASQYDKAIEFYQKILDSSPTAPQATGRAGRSPQARAANGLAAVKLMKTIDLAKISDGSYTAQTAAYNGTMTIKVEVKDARIEKVEVVQHRETPNYLSRAMPITNQIVAQQGFSEVHAVTGATYSSDGIINAAAEALSKASNTETE